MDEKYSAALERAKVVIFNAYHEETKTACREIFPELAESDDEMTRKELLDFISSPDVSRMLDEEKQAKFYAYIEKQKEQKPVKMVHIPKFRVGDIVQHVHEKWDRTMKIAEIDECGYRCDFSHRGHPEWGGGFGFTCEDDYELVERKPVMWSEEDEKQYQFVLDELRYAHSELTCHNSTIDSIKQFEKAVAWLDDRVKFICPQAKQEWSKEDKGNLLAVRCIIDGVWHDQDAREKMERSEEELESLWKWLDNIWTKVVYPQSQWKPSKEQIEALECAERWYSDNMGSNSHLWQLLCDLKKL